MKLWKWCREYFLFHCPHLVNQRRTLLNTFGNFNYSWLENTNIGNFNYSLLENTNNVFTKTLLFENTSLTPSDKSKIPSATFLVLRLILSNRLKDLYLLTTNKQIKVNIVFGLLLFKKCTFLFYWSQATFIFLGEWWAPSFFMILI